MVANGTPNWRELIDLRNEEKWDHEKGEQLVAGTRRDHTR